MKRWNKQKRSRDLHWAEIRGLSYVHYRKALRWCLTRDGKKFFNEEYIAIPKTVVMSANFFFEDAEDATAFYLTWINKPEQVS